MSSALNAKQITSPPKVLSQAKPAADQSAIVKGIKQQGQCQTAPSYKTLNNLAVSSAELPSKQTIQQQPTSLPKTPSGNKTALANQQAYNTSSKQ